MKLYTWFSGSCRKNDTLNISIECVCVIYHATRCFSIPFHHATCILIDLDRCMPSTYLATSIPYYNCVMYGGLITTGQWQLLKTWNGDNLD